MAAAYGCMDNKSGSTEMPGSAAISGWTDISGSGSNELEGWTEKRVYIQLGPERTNFLKVILNK